MDQRSDALNRDLDRDVSPVDREAYDVDRTTGLTAADENVDTSDPDAIRANIERTRAEMGSTIDEIQDRLAPSHLAEQAKEAVRDATMSTVEDIREATIGRVEDMWQSAGDNVEYARQSMFETVRSNPIPAALVGLGLGWLFMNRRSAPETRYSGRGSYRGGDYRSSDRGYRAYDESPRYYDRETQYGGGQRRYSEARYGEGPYRQEPGIADRARETAGNVAGSVRETASDVASNVRDTASDVADRARDTASDLAERAQYGAQRVEDRVGDLMTDNPLALGAIALIAGAAVGLALPQTERENQLMGETRDRVVEQAQDVAREAVDRAKVVASDVADQAKSAASDVAEQAKSSVQQQANQAGR